MEWDLSYSGEGRNYEPVGHNRPDPPACGLSRGRHWSSMRVGPQGLTLTGEKRTSPGESPYIIL
jgi:hypothetical protein